jgi:hypothetical protein
VNPRRLQPTIEIHGPAATHNMPCAVYHHIPELAVIDLSVGVFKPSWKAQRDQWNRRADNRGEGHDH